MRKEKRTALINGRATTMRDLHEARWTNCYFPSRVIIKRVFEGDKSYFDKASIIVEKWYKLEGTCFDSVKDFLEEGYNDIEELADAATDEEERHIVWMALLGYDPYEDEE